MAATPPSNEIQTSSGTPGLFGQFSLQASNGLKELIQLLLDKADDALYELSSKIEDDEGDNKYFAAMRQLRLNRKVIEGQFEDFLRQSFVALQNNEVAAELEQRTDELSLVDEDEMELQIALSNMVDKSRPLFEDDLLLLTERLGSLLPRQIEDDFNPLDPKSVCNSFHLALKDQQADIEIKLILYKLFDKFVLSQFADLYQHLNQYLIGKGVLPNLQVDQILRDKRNRFKPKREKATTPALDEDLFGSLQNSLFAGQTEENAPGLPGVAHNPEYLSALSSFQSTMLQATPVPSDTDPQQYKLQLQQQLDDFKQQHGHQAGKIDNQIIDIISMLFDYFFEDQNLPDPIKVLIGRLQIPILKVAILDQSFFNSTEHPARKLLDSISRASLGWSSGDGQESVVIDKLEEIVDALVHQFKEDIGVFELALLQFQQFLQQESDSVDINLRQLEQQESQRDQQISEARQLTDQLLTKLLAKHDFSPEVIDFFNGIWNKVMFNTCLTQGPDSDQWTNLRKISSTLIWTLIPKHTDKQKKKLLKMLPPLQRALTRGMQLVQIDQQQQAEVFRTLASEHSNVVKQTSKNIALHQEKLWGGDSKVAEAMAKFNAQRALEQQDDNDAEEERTQDMEVVDMSMQPELDIDLMKEISTSEAIDVIRNLDDFSHGIASGEIRLDHEVLEQGAQQAEYQQQSDPQTDEFLQQARALEIGGWVQFNHPQDKKYNARLSWKSNITGKYVFVNRKGIKLRNITVYGLAGELRDGQAIVIESLSVFDRAINFLMMKKAA